jgi:hypothetical protein
MITWIFVEKTLQDIGAFFAEELSDDKGATIWPYRFPFLKGHITWRKTPNTSNLEQVSLCFDDYELQDTATNIAKNLNLPAKNGHVQFTKAYEIEEYFRRMHKQIDALPDDFKPLEEEDFSPKLDRSDTETIGETKQRKGQDIYRNRLMKLWDSKCSVTGCDIPEALKASHAKPWAKCETGAERLNPYNGFLLTPTLDTLFDAGLITFELDGTIKISSEINDENRIALGIKEDMKLRFIRPEHEQFLKYHHNKVFRR